MPVLVVLLLLEIGCILQGKNIELKREADGLKERLQRTLDLLKSEEMVIDDLLSKNADVFEVRSRATDVDEGSL